MSLLPNAVDQVFNEGEPSFMVSWGRLHVSAGLYKKEGIDGKHPEEYVMKKESKIGLAMDWKLDGSDLRENQRK